MLRNCQTDGGTRKLVEGLTDKHSRKDGTGLVQVLNNVTSWISCIQSNSGFSVSRR